MPGPTKTCFIAMPVATTDAQSMLYNDGEHWKHVMEELFVPAVEAAGFEAWRPVAKGSHMIHAEIVRQLAQADMVLCDISHDNPNVFFELGVRTSVNKPIALVRCDATTRIPFDVNVVNTYTYDPSLKSHLMKDQRALLEAHLRAAEETCNGENPVWKQYGLELKAHEPTAGGSAQDAMLTVLASRLDELSSQVGELSSESKAEASRREVRAQVVRGLKADERARRVPRSLAQQMEDKGVTLGDIQSVVAEQAKKYGYQYEEEYHPREGGQVVVLTEPQSVAEFDEFRKVITRATRNMGFPVNVSLTPALRGKRLAGGEPTGEEPAPS